jgi:hypothetical protein
VTIGIVGVGAVGARVARHLGADVVLYDHRDAPARAIAGRLGLLQLDLPGVAAASDLVVLAGAAPQCELAQVLVEGGVHVVTTSDDPDDCAALLDLDALARTHDAVLVVGAAMAPGLSGLLSASLAGRLDRADEVHIAAHGTGGPDCARQHHDALSGMADGWHDGGWIRRPAGSSRELCWFPEPIGGRDCYRAAMADPLLLHTAMPELQRISARMSATRRDRLTARLPMLSPPHREGGIGALRVEVRGNRGQARVGLVAGVAERAAAVAAAVAASVAASIAERRWVPEPGAVVLGDPDCPTAELLADIARRGIALQEYAGME